MIFLVRLMTQIRRSPVRTLGVALALVTVALAANSWAWVAFDGMSWEDAIWGSIISITTIGYGDISPQHPLARVASFLFIVVLGLTAFTLLVGMMTDRITEFAERGRRGMTPIVHHDHILIINFPSSSRVRQVIREVQSDETWEQREIVLLCDTIERLPFSLERVSFVCGSPFEVESFQRANLESAHAALILSPDYADPQSDAVASSIVAVIENLNREVHTVAECLDENHRILFETTHCNSIVCGPQLSSNLLIQELHDPGVAQTMEVISSNQQCPTLFSTEVEAGSSVLYAHLAKSLIDQGANLLSVIRGSETFTAFADLQSKAGDRLVFVAPKRMQWNELQRLA